MFGMFSIGSLCIDYYVIIAVAVISVGRYCCDL